MLQITASWAFRTVAASRCLSRSFTSRIDTDLESLYEPGVIRFQDLQNANECVSFRPEDRAEPISSK